MAEHNETGKNGELYAKNYLLKNGYKVLEVNWRNRHLELDLIAKKDDTLVVVEVKTRNKYFLENSWNSVSKQKQRNIINATNSYIFKKDLDVDVRFDIINVTLLGKDHKIDHVEDAFYPILSKR